MGQVALLLMALYNATGGEQWGGAYSSSCRAQRSSCWGSQPDYCQWKGVLCSQDGQSRLQGLALPNFGLRGQLPRRQFRQLSRDFRALSLAGSLADDPSLKLRGDVLEALHPEAPLVRLNIERNALSGDVGGFSRYCRTLKSLRLGHNLYSGSLQPLSNCPEAAGIRCRG